MVYAVTCRQCVLISPRSSRADRIVARRSAVETGVIDICDGRENRRRLRDGAEDYLKDRERALNGESSGTAAKGIPGSPARSKKQQITGFFEPRPAARVLFISRTLPTWRTVSIFVTAPRTLRDRSTCVSRLFRAASRVHAPRPGEQSTRFVRQIRRNSLRPQQFAADSSRGIARLHVQRLRRVPEALLARDSSGTFVLNCELFVVYARQAEPSTQLRLALTWPLRINRTAFVLLYAEETKF